MNHLFKGYALSTRRRIRNICCTNPGTVTRTLQLRIMHSLLVAAVTILCQSQVANKASNADDYLQEVKAELKKEWPNNRTINLVFHGHSVPAGYFKTPVVNTLGAYPFLLLKNLKELYPYAVINVIVTSIGGENSIAGAKRFESEVLVHKPDVLFIDYALNDRSVGLNESAAAWSKMIEKAVQHNIKVILLTPSPDQSVNILDSNSDLEKHSSQVKDLAKKYGVGLADSYQQFKQKVIAGDSLSNYMSQVNHPNEKGHALIADEIMKYFK